MMQVYKMSKQYLKIFMRQSATEAKWLCSSNSMTSDPTPFFFGSGNIAGGQMHLWC